MYIPWVEILTDTGKEAFLNIQTILHKYYQVDQHLKARNNEQDTYGLLYDHEKFIARFITLPIETMRIFLKWTYGYEYRVVVKIKFKNKVIRKSWIHLDGIAEERKLHGARGNFTHPVFEIPCASDIFQAQRFYLKFLDVTKEATKDDHENKRVPVGTNSGNATSIKK